MSEEAMPENKEAAVEDKGQEKKKQLTLTPASEWKKQARARYLLRLPSGNVVRAKRPDYVRLGIEGILDPDELVSISALTTVERNRKALELMPRVLPHIIEVPRVVLSEDAQEDCITIDDISDMDKLAVFAWSSGMLAAGMIEEEKING